MKLDRRAKDIRGMTFSLLTVVDATHQRDTDGAIIWSCRCRCGNTKRYPTTYLIRKTRSVKSCGCVRRGHLNPLYGGTGDLSGARFGHIMGSARRRSIAFDITIEFAWKLFLKQKKRCALTGLELTLYPEHRIRSGDKSTASLDRIDSRKGYILGNIQWVHKTVNLMKRDLSNDEFKKWCRAVCEFGKGTKEKPHNY